MSRKGSQLPQITQGANRAGLRWPGFLFKAEVLVWLPVSRSTRVATPSEHPPRRSDSDERTDGMITASYLVQVSTSTG